MIRSLDQQHKIDFYVSWTFVSVALLVFIFSLTFIYEVRKKDASYVEHLEEQNYILRNQNVDLKHELRDTINYYRSKTNSVLNVRK
jgi:hypothetical protein